MTTAHLVTRLVRVRWASHAGLAGAALVLAAAFAGSNLLQTSVAQAVQATVLSENGGLDFAVQVIDGDRADDVLARRTDLVPVLDRTSEISTSQRSLPATVRTVDERGAETGLLVNGARPRRAGEATVSTSVLRSLDARLGDLVRVQDPDGRVIPVRVTGATLSPASPDEYSAVLVVDSLRPDQVSSYLTDTDPFVDPELGPLLNDRALKGRTLQVLAQDRARSTTNELLSSLGYAGPALTILSACLLLCLMVAMARGSRHDISALQGAGMTIARAWRVPSYAASALVLVGTVGGVAVTVGAATLLKVPLAATVGQEWVSVAVSWPQLVSYALALPGFLLLVALGAAWSLGRVGRIHLPNVAPRLRWAVAAVGLWAVMLGLTVARVMPVQVGAYLGALAAVAMPVLVGRAVLRGGGPAQSRVVREVSASLLPVVAVVALLVWATTCFSAVAMHSGISMRDTSAAVQPPGSMLVYELPSKAADALRREYLRLGGRDVATYRLPVEDSQQIRAASSTMVECMAREGTDDPAEASADCVPDDSATPVNFVVLSTAPQSQEVLADPSLVEDGRLGVLTFTSESEGRAVGATQVSAGPTGLLGGNMPGAVIESGSATAQELGLRAADGELVAFLDFASLDSADQATFRAFVARTASAAQVAEERSQYGDVALRFAIARAWAAAGSTVAAVLLTFAGGLVVASHARLRRMLFEIGSQRSRRRRLLVRAFAVPVVTIVAAGAVGRCSAWLLGVHDGTGFGWVWILPTVFGALGAVTLGSFFARPPAREVA